MPDLWRALLFFSMLLLMAIVAASCGVECSSRSPRYGACIVDVAPRLEPVRGADVDAAIDAVILAGEWRHSRRLLRELARMAPPTVRVAKDIIRDERSGALFAGLFFPPSDVLLSWPDGSCVWATAAAHELTHWLSDVDDLRYDPEHERDELWASGGVVERADLELDAYCAAMVPHD